MRQIKNKIEKPWYVYILLCDDGTLYTGMAIDVQNRFEMHQTGKGARYTRSRGAKEIVYIEKCLNRNAAALREIEIKKLPRSKKVNLYKKV